MTRAEIAQAEIALALVDADVARYYVNDGQLSLQPLDGPLTQGGQELRDRRLAAVAALEAAGGRDPHPSFLQPPTPAQRVAWEARHRPPADVDMPL